MKEVRAIHRDVGKVALALVAGLLLATAWMFFYSGPASAQADPYSTKTPKVLPTRITDDEPNRNPDKDETDKVQAVTPEEREGVLPFTGGDVVTFVVIGAVAVGTGYLLVRRTRTNE